MLLSFAAIIFGLALLVWSADRFVSGAAALARNLGVSPLLIGLTVVGVGTSAPEMLVSVMAAYSGNMGMAVGNAVGSNTANIGLILGTTAAIAPLTIASGVLRREYPLMLGISLLGYILLIDSELQRLDGFILLIGLIGTLLLMIRIARSQRDHDPLQLELEEEIPVGISTGRAGLLIGVGLAVLLVSSRLLVWGATNVALAFGVSDLVIGLTIVAVGTSLPELAASISSALKREHDIAFGNILGSNIFNILAVLSPAALIAPGTIDPAAISRDLPVMLAFSVLLFLLGRGRNGAGRIGRGAGFALLAAYLGYQFWLYRVTVGG